MITVPIAAHAGFIPDSLSLRRFLLGEAAFSASSVSASNSYNSQNIPLLAGIRTPEKTAPRGGGDITIVAGSAILPSEGPSGTFAIDESPKTDQVSIYVVRAGDAISEIADMYGVSVNTILWANDLKRGAPIKEGQVLVILPVTGVRHTVSKGETIASIVKKYKGDLEEVLSYNGLSAGSGLKAGEVLIIPHGEIIAAPVKKTTTQAIVRGTSGPEYSGYFIHPLPSGKKTQGIHGYNGIDIGAPVGTPVRAAAGGAVTISRSGGWNGGYGTYVVISHDNGTQTLYAHHTQNVVSMGETVAQGQVIGYVGATGRATGPHLHFEIRGAKNPF